MSGAGPPEPDPELAREERVQRALELGYRYLGHRDRTCQEMRTHLRRKEVREAEAEAAIETLIRQGYLDDARFAQRFAEDKRALDGWGAERITRRLRELGVEAEDVTAAVDARDREDELDAAIGILHAKLRRPPADDRERNRALGLLARRGYDLELAHEAIRAYDRARL